MLSNALEGARVQNESPLKALEALALLNTPLVPNLFTGKSLTNDKILDWFKLKAFAEDKINVNEKFKFGLGRVETQ